MLTVRNPLLASNQFMIDHLKKSSRKDNQTWLAELEEAEREREQDLRVPKHLLTLDARVSQLTALETLDLSHNQLEHLPASLGSLPALRRLILNENRLTDIPASLAQLSRLELLDLRDNPIRSRPDFPRLKRYDVYQTHFGQQKREAMRAREIELAAWLYQQETRYGLVL